MPADSSPAVQMLVAEAAPRAEKLLTILLGPADASGARSGGMVGSQTEMLGQDTQAVASSVSTLLVTQWALLALGVILGGAIAFFTARAISRPLVQMTGAMSKLAEGDLDTEVPSRERRDEIGGMAAAVEIFKQAGVDCRVLSMTSDMLERPAPRPAFSVLISEREHPVLLPDWREGLTGYLAERAEREVRT